MTIYLRQSTASQEIPLGYFVDSADGNTEETGLTIANTDIKVWKTGATSLASKNSGGATHIANGVYYCVLDATDTDTLGPLRIFIHVAGALAVKVDCVVLDEAQYDFMFGTNAPATQASVDTITTRLGTPSDLGGGATVAANLADIEGQTDDIGAAGAGLTAADDAILTAISNLNNLSQANIRTALGMASANLDTQLGAIDDLIDSEVAAIKTVVDAIKVTTDKFVFTIANKVDSSIQAAADIAAAVANKLADHFWRRTYANIRGSSDGDSVAFRSGLGAQSKLVNKWFFDGADLVLNHEDDSTEFGRQTAGTSPTAEPITELDTN
jgi:hypothetical protein